MTLLRDEHRHPLRAALYCRISEDPRDLQAGVDRQKADCRAYAERQGWTVVDTFIDNDTPAFKGSTRSGKQRTDYHRLIDAVKSGKFDVVVGYHSSRWHCDVMEYFEFVKLLKTTGIAWHTAMEGEIRFSSATDEATSSVRAVFNQLESALKSERIRRAKLDEALAGQHNGGIRCYGYEPDGMTVREDEAAEIRRLADAVICGQSLRSLALELNARGVPTVKGKKWASAHLRSMLLRPRLAALREHRGKIVAKGQWPPIIDKETHEALKAVLEDPRRCTGGSGRRGPVPTSLGTGIYVCGVCGEPRLRLGRSNARRAVYKCGNIDTSQAMGHVTRVADKLDAYVEGALLDVISRPGVIEAMCAVVDTDDAELAALRAEQVTIRPRLNKAAKRYEADEIDDEQLAIISKGLRNRDNEITAILTAANMRSPLDVLLGAESVEQMWDDVLTLGQQRAILAEVLTVTVLPTRSGGRAPDGSYFNADAVDIALTERAAAVTRG